VNGSINTDALPPGSNTMEQESVIIQVEFNKEEEAVVFKRYFDGTKAI
jgi:hypothetical protein